MSAPRPPLLALALLASACRETPGDDTSGPLRWDPASTVILVTVDTLQASFLWGHDEGWDTAPFLQDLFEEGVLLPDVQVARNLTGPALTTILTGTYPRDHKVRENEEVAPTLPLISERFREVGYRTLGFAANMCPLLDYGFDETECTDDLEQPDLGDESDRDDVAAADLLAAIGALDADEPVFAWLHLNQVHHPYLVVESWYEAFHPDPYEGDLDVRDVEALDEITLGRAEATEEDLRHLDAVFASEVRATDERIASFTAALDEMGRWDDAVFVFGADHGEELGDHFDYFYHGCSPYEPVARVAFSFRAPGRLPEGVTLDGWVSQADIAPTIVDLASAFEWTDFLAGRSLVDEMLAGALDEQPAYFERGVETAGLAFDGHRFMLSGVEGFDACVPYNRDPAVFPSEPCELYDLGADPGETANLADAPGQAALLEDLADRVCAWVDERPWVGTDEMMALNGVVRTCATR